MILKISEKENICGVQTPCNKPDSLQIFDWLWSDSFRGRKWETTHEKNFSRKIIMERILSIVIVDARNRVWHLKMKKTNSFLNIFWVFLIILYWKDSSFVSHRLYSNVVYSFPYDMLFNDALIYLYLLNQQIYSIATCKWFGNLSFFFSWIQKNNRCIFSNKVYYTWLLYILENIFWLI